MELLSGKDHADLAAFKVQNRFFNTSHTRKKFSDEFNTSNTTKNARSHCLQLFVVNPKKLNLPLGSKFRKNI